MKPNECNLFLFFWIANKPEEQSEGKKQQNKTKQYHIDCQNTAIGAHSIAQFDINSIWQFGWRFCSSSLEILCDMSCSILFGNRRHRYHLNFKSQSVGLYCIVMVQNCLPKKKQLKDESMSYIIAGSVHVRNSFVHSLSKLNKIKNTIITGAAVYIVYVVLKHLKIP